MSGRRIVPAGLMAAALLALPVLATSAVTSATAADTPSGGGDDLPPRILAVLEPGKGCTKPSTAGVKTASAAHRTLTPALAWQLTQGQGVTVAVLDTGLSTGSLPQLTGRVTRGPDEVTGGSTSGDCTGHGTFVAGLIAAGAQSGTTVVGIAPRAHVYAVTVADRNGATGPDVLAKGITDAVRAGARIIVVSVVSPKSNRHLADAVKDAQTKGALLLAPAVADDQNLDGPIYPAALPGVLSVANSVPASKGSSLDATLSAPGDVVLSTGPGGGAFIGSGAAYSTALVAGTAALMDSYRPGLTLAQRVRRLTETAYPSVTGPAIVDPYAAVTELLPGDSGVVAPPLARTPVSAMPPATVDPAWHAGLAVGGIGAVVALVALGALATVRRGRERDWRPDGPAQQPSGPAPAATGQP